MLLSKEENLKKVMNSNKLFLKSKSLDFKKSSLRLPLVISAMISD